MKKTAKRIKKTAVKIPQDEAELSALIREVLTAQNEQKAAIAKRDALLLKLRERVENKHRFDSRVQAASLTISSALERLELWAVENKKEFGDARSIARAGARLGWRLGNWQIAATKKQQERAVEFLQGVITRGKAQGASERMQARAALAESMLRIKTTLDKERAISERQSRPMRALVKKAGLEFTQEETFYLDPESAEQAPAALAIPTGGKTE